MDGLEGFRARALAASAVKFEGDLKFGFWTKPTMDMCSSAAASQRAEKVGTRETSEKSQGDRNGEGGGFVLATCGQICGWT